MKKTSLIIFILTLALFFKSEKVFAHSGGTDSSGGHNCNVGSCAGTYHYHNGGSAYTKPVTTYKPVVTRKPVVSPKTRYSPKPTSKPSSTIQARSLTTSQSDDSDDDSLWAMLAMGGLGFGGYQWWKNKK